MSSEGECFDHRLVLSRQLMVELAHRVDDDISSTDSVYVADSILSAGW